MVKICAVTTVDLPRASSYVIVVFYVNFPFYVSLIKTIQYVISFFMKANCIIWRGIVPLCECKVIIIFSG